jgi:gliding motility-associated-like protein
VIWNEGGCSDSLTAEVCLDDSVYVLMPNAFSPNNDGINDFLNIPTAGVEEFELLIFNRWGEFVFQTSDKNVSWDGTYLGEPVQKGAYAYYLKFKGKKTTKRQMRGVLIIL